MTYHSYAVTRWHHKILLHNGKVLRLAIPLEAAAKLGWKPGDLLRIEIHATPDGLSLTKPQDRRVGSAFKQPIA